MMKWFGVKTVYRTTSVGKPKNIDEFFSNNIDLVEERIVLVKAVGIDEAIVKVEDEAREYVDSPIKNPYDQLVKTKYLGYLDAFELFDAPDDLVEVYSSTRIVFRESKKSQIADMIFGPDEGKKEKKRRKIFLNKDFN